MLKEYGPTDGPNSGKGNREGSTTRGGKCHASLHNEAKRSRPEESTSQTGREQQTRGGHHHHNHLAV